MTNEETIRALEHIRSAIRNHIPPTKPGKAIEAIDLAIAALERDRWISASTPPDTERNVFICHGSPDFKAPCIGHYDHGRKMFYEDKNWFASPIFDAMYWCEMPRLPEPPKEDEP